MLLWNAEPLIVNRLFFDNEATSSGEGVWNADGARPTIVNSTIADNRSNAPGGGIGGGRDAKLTEPDRKDLVALLEPLSGEYPIITAPKLPSDEFSNGSV